MFKWITSLVEMTKKQTDSSVTNDYTLLNKSTQDKQKLQSLPKIKLIKTAYYTNKKN